MTQGAVAAEDSPIKGSILTTGAKVMTHETDGRRKRLYRWAIGLSVAYVADGFYMAWALLDENYRGMAYTLLSFIPVFFPSCVAGLIVSRMYWYGFTRHGWKMRKAEWLFFFLLYNAVAAKAIVFVRDWLR